VGSGLKLVLLGASNFLVAYCAEGAETIWTELVVYLF